MTLKTALLKENQIIAKDYDPPHSPHTAETDGTIDLQNELIVRTLAEEPRLNRRILSYYFAETVHDARHKTLSCKIVRTSRNAEKLYVFIVASAKEDETGEEYENFLDLRISLLEDFCNALAYENRFLKSVIGITADKNGLNSKDIDAYCLEVEKLHQQGIRIENEKIVWMKALLRPEEIIATDEPGFELFPASAVLALNQQNNAPLQPQKKLTDYIKDEVTTIILKGDRGEEDDLRASGAVYDEEKKQWFVPAGRDLRKFEYWLDPDQSIAIQPVYLIAAKDCCWKCKQETFVYTIACEEYYYGYDRAVYNGFIVLSTITVLPDEIITLLKDKCPRYYLDYSKMHESSYFMNHCHCGAKLGDFYMHKEPGGAFHLIDKSDCCRVALIPLPLKHNLPIVASMTVAPSNPIKYAKLIQWSDLKST